MARKRKAALGMLLEPSSPGAAPAEEGSKAEKEKAPGGGELFGNPKLSKNGAGATSNKGLFGDDGGPPARWHASRVLLCDAWPGRLLCYG